MQLDQSLTQNSNLWPRPSASPGARRRVSFGAVAIAAGLALTACSSTTSADSATTAETESTPETAETSPSDSDTTANGETTKALYNLVEGELPIEIETVNQMVTFVEENTGREFLTEPQIAVESEDEFNARIEVLTEEAEEQVGTDENDLELAARYYQALGQTDLGAAELSQTFDELEGSDIALGLYDPEIDTLFIPDNSLDQETFEITLVHELVHALDDQYVDLEEILDQIDEDSSSEQVFTTRSVVEGRATAIQYAWMAENQVELTDPEISPTLESLPSSFIIGQVLPYELGAVMVDTLGGASQTWELYEDLPESSEQVMFPQKIGEDSPVTVQNPTATGGPVLDESEFGAADLLLLAASDSELLEPDFAQIQQAQLAADGFGGGQAVLWGDETQSCIAVDVVADSAEAAANIEAVFTSLEPGSEVSQETSVVANTVSFQSCSPFEA